MKNISRVFTVSAVLGLMAILLFAPTESLAKDKQGKKEDVQVKATSKAETEAAPKPVAKPAAKAPQKKVAKPAPKPVAKPTPKPATKPTPAKPAAPATHTVKKKKFSIFLNLKGVFQSTRSGLYTLKPEFWQSFKVTKILPHGAAVKKGDVIIEFDPKSLDAAIKDFEAARTVADLEYQAAQQELNFLEETVPMDMALAEQSKKYFDQDYQYYKKIELPLAKQLAVENVKQAEQYLSYAMEELKQLEKMYKADDLTEETEQIILTRQRNTVNRLKLNVKRSQLSRDRTLQALIPREESQGKRNEKISELRIQAARLNFPRMLTQKRLALQKITRSREKALETYKKMRRDRGRMQVKSPADGFVYYGGSSRGNFASVSTVAALVKPGNLVKPGSTVFTVVTTSPLIVRTTIPEASLRFAKSGITGRISPTAFPDTKLSAKLAIVSLAPLMPGKFDATIEVNGGKPAPHIMPGMTCTTKLTAYQKDNALVVPTSTVRSEDDGRRFVHVLQKDGKSKKQYIKAGQWTTTETEIVSGLREGDKILTSPPKS